MWPAPLFLELAATLLAAALGLTVDAAAPDVPEACCVVAADPLVAAAVGAAPVGVSEPLISAWTVELKVPVMPLRLFEPLRGELKSRRGYYTRELGRKRLGGELGLGGIFQAIRRKPDKAGKGDWPSFRKERNTILTSC
jgi:hypothetical protein